jgi:hypothetical protein
MKLSGVKRTATKQGQPPEEIPKIPRRHRRTLEEEHADEGTREARVERLLLGGADGSLDGRDEPLLRVRLPPIVRCGGGPLGQSRV